MIDDIAEALVAHVANSLLEDGAVLCFGVGCPLRGHCARYLALDGIEGERSLIDTCRVQTWFPMFIEAHG